MQSPAPAQGSSFPWGSCAFTPQKFPSAIRKSGPLMTLLPKLPQKLQFKVPVKVDVYTFLQAHTCTHNYSGIKQACKLPLFRHQRRDCWFDWKLEESLIKAWERSWSIVPVLAWGAEVLQRTSFCHQNKKNCLMFTFNSVFSFSQKARRVAKENKISFVCCWD